MSAPRRLTLADQPGIVAKFPHARTITMHSITGGMRRVAVALAIFAGALTSQRAAANAHDLELWNVQTGAITIVERSGPMREALVGVGVLPGAWFTLQRDGRAGRSLIARMRDAQGQEIVRRTLPLVSEGYAGGTSMIISPDGDQLAYDSYKTRSLRLHDLDDGDDRELLPDFRSMHWMTYTGRERVLVARWVGPPDAKARARGALVQIDTAARTVEPVLELDGMYSGLSLGLSASKRYLGYTSTTMRRGEPRWIRVFDLKEKRELTKVDVPGDVWMSGVTVADDGRSVAWVQNSREAADVMIAAIEPGAAPRMLQHYAAASCLGFTFVGDNTLAFTRGARATQGRGSTVKALVTVDRATGRARVLGEREFNGPMTALPGQPVLICTVGY